MERRKNSRVKSIVAILAGKDRRKHDKLYSIICILAISLVVGFICVSVGFSFADR